jgi:16S rRNA (guanine527-N7)-methyltransferase
MIGWEATGSGSSGVISAFFPGFVSVVRPTHGRDAVAVILGSRTEKAADVAACAVSSRPDPVMVDRRFHVKRRTELRMGSVSDRVAADKSGTTDQLAAGDDSGNPERSGARQETGTSPGSNTPAEGGPVARSAELVFGTHLPLAQRYVDLLTEHGVPRGLIGPREVDRLWDRHVLNSAVLSELIPEDATVIDVGSGAGLPGFPLAIARPDLRVTLLEPMARRVAWLTEVAQDLDIDIQIERGRAEEPDVRRRLGQADVVTARAVAPLAKLAGWCLPLVRPGGLVDGVERRERERRVGQGCGSGPSRGWHRAVRGGVRGGCSPRSYNDCDGAEVRVGGRP